MTKSNNLLADYAAKKQDICIKNDTISDSFSGNIVSTEDLGM